MSLAIVHSRALSAKGAAQVLVEVHLANGLPGMSIVGLPDTEVRESRERVRAALQQCGFTFPARRITVNLAPADLPKESGRFDLPIALGILVASGQLPEKALSDGVFAGELSLTGRLRGIRGAFAMACGLPDQHDGALPNRPDQPIRPIRLYLPLENAAEAARVPGIEIYGAADLPTLCAHLRGDPGGQLTPAVATEGLSTATDTTSGNTTSALPDMSDVIGQTAGKRALEVAAAGEHHILLIGPPGAGKSMLAARLPGILPPMSDAEAMASAALLSSSTAHFSAASWRRRPYRTPHHSSSPAALVGGGNPPRPGEITLAHHGVLFLDELPEFERRTLEMLREPLESGEITISRAGAQTAFPARCQLVAAMNPCPCGWNGDPSGRCRCAPEAAVRYRAKLSAPLLDRIDLQLVIPALSASELSARQWGQESDGAPAQRGDSSHAIRQRVSAARARQISRQACSNGHLGHQQTQRFCGLGQDSRELLERATARFGWSARAHFRLLKVARTIADLDDQENIQTPHMAEAIAYRPAW